MGALQGAEGAKKTGGMFMFTRLLAAVSLLSLTGAFAPAAAGNRVDTEEYLLADGFRVHDYCLVAMRHRHHLDFYRDFRALNDDGSVNAVIEIPAGTNSKFEVSEETGQMCWEFKNGAPRVIKYLGYPSNYGMIPRTLGGDGDSLDVLTLGKFERRGEVVRAKIIAVMKMIDGGDRDDKIIAVLPGTDLYDANSLTELEVTHPGITTILKAWFEGYKGPDEIVVERFGDAEEALAVVEDAMAAFQN
jgi:inorganic pyrophosphatase